jgi:(S)-ureidoglycine-glyoxylate aminotransferase
MSIRNSKEEVYWEFLSFLVIQKGRTLMQLREINPSPRTLMTPGPVEADPRVLRAMSCHILGQFDPEFTSLMNETMEMERCVFQTNNRQTYVVDTTSRGGLETVLTGAICPGDKVLIPAFGRFGYLLAEILERCGAEITLLEREWGTVFDPQEIEDALKVDNYKAVACIHGETSTSMMQPLSEIGEICERYGALLIVDSVATLGGTEVKVDEWKLSACISGTQKCISAPSGSALITYNQQIEDIVKLRKRVEKGIRTAADVAGSLAGISSNYLDLGQLEDYWSPRRLNHHTEATSMQYALHEALRCILDETLEARFARHSLNDKALTAGLRAMGLTIFGDLNHKMPVVTAINIPEGADGKVIRGMLLTDFGIEIATSFGPLDGKILRIGNMGYSSQKRNILILLGALEAVMLANGVKIFTGDAIAAARAVYKAEEA